MIVVDTNILAYLWLPSNRQNDAIQLGRLYPEWAAPLLWRSEFRNVTAGLLRKGQLTRTEAEAATSRAARSLLGGEYSVDDHAVLDLVATSRCSAYNCEFVALAQSRGTFLVTEDKQLLSSFPNRCKSITNALKQAPS